MCDFDDFDVFEVPIMKLLLILAWFYLCFVKLDLGAFEGSSDQWILMIFGCVILLYFTVVFEWFWCFEVV